MQPSVRFPIALFIRIEKCLCLSYFWKYFVKVYNFSAFNFFNSSSSSVNCPSLISSWLLLFICFLFVFFFLFFSVALSVISGGFPSRLLKCSFHFCNLSSWLAAFRFLSLTSFSACHSNRYFLSTTEFLISLIWLWMYSCCTFVRGAYDKFPDFFRVALLLIVHTWNSSSLRGNLLRLQYTCCTVTTTSGTPHGSPLVWACQWPSSQPLSSPQLSLSNDSLWA